MKQEDILEHLSKAISNYKKTPEKRLTQSYIESRLENINKMRESFTEVHFKIVKKVERGDKAKTEYFTHDMYTTVEDIYTE